MRSSARQTAVVLVSLAGVAMGLAGCRFDEHKKDGKENVRIATPFGGMSVKTDESSVQNGVGIDPYPGATLEQKEGKDHDNAADVNLNFAGFHLGVKALSYTTPDPPDKVLAFYRGKLTKYGVVIQCEHDEPVGTPTRTQDGLTCENDHDHHGVHINVSGSDDHAKNELKAGSKQHQHIVSVEPRGTGTKFGLVMIDLPMNPDGDSDDKQ
jgi:hypothetical protein